MDIQKGLPLSWTYFYQEKIMEDVRQSQLLSMELEETRLKAQEELRFRDEQIIQLKDMLTRAIMERDGAQENCQAMFLEKLLLQQQLQCHPAAPDSGVSSVEDEHPAGGMNSNNGFSSPDSDESIVSSPPNLHPPPPPEVELELEPELPFVPDMPLPQKGRLLEAVMKAGPLLQTLLLAGPLPQWRHPPPPLDHYQIPPPPVVISSSAALPTVPPPVFCQQHPFNGVVNCGSMSRKRVLSEGSDTSIETKSHKGFSSAAIDGTF